MIVVVAASALVARSKNLKKQTLQFEFNYLDSVAYFQMIKRVKVSQAIFWATAILLIPLVDDTKLLMLLMVILATASIANLNKK